MTKTCQRCHKDFEGENASKWCIPCGNKVRLSQWRTKNANRIMERYCQRCGAKFHAKSDAKYCLDHRNGERNKSISRTFKANHEKERDWSWCQLFGDLVYPCPRHDKIFRYKCGLTDVAVCPLLMGRIVGAVSPKGPIQEVA